MSIGLVLAANLRARRVGVPMRAVAAGWLLVLAHPGIWLSVTSGDCGALRVERGLLFTALAAAIGVWGMIRTPPLDQDTADRSPRP